MDIDKLIAFCDALPAELKHLQPTVYLEDTVGYPHLVIVSSDEETWGVSTDAMEAFLSTVPGRRKSPPIAPATKFVIIRREDSDFVWDIGASTMFGKITPRIAVPWIQRACNILEKEIPGDLRIERKGLVDLLR